MEIIGQLAYWKETKIKSDTDNQIVTNNKNVLIKIWNAFKLVKIDINLFYVFVLVLQLYEKDFVSHNSLN